jgi:hypothetical protein
MDARHISRGVLIGALALGGCNAGPQEPTVYAVDSMKVDTPPPVPPQTTWRTGPRQRVTLRGRIVDVVHLTPAAPPHDHTLATVELPDGRRQVIDLARWNPVADGLLTTGQQIAAEGSLTEAHGQWVLLAERARTGNTWRHIYQPPHHPAR